MSPVGVLGSGVDATGIVVSDTDPGAVGPGILWLQTGPSVEPYVIVWLRNADDDGWLIVTTGAITQTATGDIDVWDPGFQSNLFLRSFDGTARTRLLDGDDGLVIGPGIVRVLTTGGLTSKTANPGFIAISVDPSAGAGFVAPAGSVALRKNGITGEVWVKSGVADTDWERVAVLGDIPAGFTDTSLAAYHAASGVLIRSANVLVLESADGGHNLTLDADGGLALAGQPIGTQAAHVADGSTVDELRDALIASGLMAGA